MNSIQTKPDAISEQAWASAPLDLLEKTKIDSSIGLNAAQVAARQAEYGLNALRTVKPRSIWSILFAQFKSIIVLLLAVASGVALAFGQHIEAYSILVVLLINGIIGAVTEKRAVTSMDALRKLTARTARVIRDGVTTDVDAQSLVPGDIVVLEAGDIISADLRLLESSKLQANEAALTGESLPVSKSTGVLPVATPLSERQNMLYKGTLLTRGSGLGMVTATGMGTELGHISSLVEEKGDESTPLEDKLTRLGHRLVQIMLVIIVGVTAVGIQSGRDLYQMIETAIALAVATVPEGLPVVATLALARGMWRMAKQNALIEKLSAVETLGSTNIIITDKTGTLTENKMAVERFLTTGDDILIAGGEAGDEAKPFTIAGAKVDAGDYPRVQDMIRVGVLCNNAELAEPPAESTGDPMEVALLAAGRVASIFRKNELLNFPEISEEAFDPELKMMATTHAAGNEFLVCVKGAPEEVLSHCSHFIDAARPSGGKDFTGAQAVLDEQTAGLWQKKFDAASGDGARLLALAAKLCKTADQAPYQELTFLGCAVMRDRPRGDVGEVIAACRAAGVRIVMATGDHPNTAKAIGQAVGLGSATGAEVVLGGELDEPERLREPVKNKLLRANIIARCSPEDKLQLLKLYAQNGAVTAMLGDGINDVPALHSAHIGVAMGRRGTQAAKEAAAMILQDDRLSTVAVAIEQGRIIFNNIRKFVRYLFSCNLSEIFVIGAASLMGLPLPLLPLQILFLNLVTDVFPAMALGACEGNRNIMRVAPRAAGEPMMKPRHWGEVVVFAIVITGTVLLAQIYALEEQGYSDGQANTVAFAVLALAQLWHALNMTEPYSGIVRNEVMRNSLVWGAIALCIVLVGISLFTPLAGILSLEEIPGAAWGWVVAVSFIPIPFGVVYRLLVKKLMQSN